MSTACTGRETNVRVTAEVCASPSTVLRATGLGLIELLMVCGIRGSPASSSRPNETYPVARDLYGSFAEARPWTPTKELLGGTLSRPRPGVAGVSVRRYGLSQVSVVKSL